MSESKEEKPELPEAVWKTARKTGLLDTDPEEAFDRLTALAGRLSDAPTALLTLLDADRQFFKSQRGLGEPWAQARQTPLTHSICKLVASADKPLVIDNTQTHEWLDDNRAVTDLNVLAYCGVPLHATDGTPIGALCVIDQEPRSWREGLPELLEEIARSVMTEIELREQSQELLELTRRQNELLGTVAHDLRSPLTVIKGYSELLLHERFGLAEQPKHMIDAMKRNSGFMLRLVDELLDLEALKSGRVQLETKLVDLTGLVKGVVELQKMLGAPKQVESKFCASESNIFVQADPRKLEQVLTNLLSNAIKFAPPKSEVEVTLEKDGEHAVLKVCDQGPGVPEEDRKKIFEPFGKSKAQPTGGEKSTGLGLAIVKKLVEAHHGSIRVTGDEQGATFEMKLPVATGEC